MGEPVKLEALAELLTPLDADAEGMLHGHCAFHEADAAPLALRVDPAAQRWWCPSCAPEGAEIVEWVMKSQGVPRGHAAELVREGSVLRKTGRNRGPLQGAVPKQSTIRRLRSPFAVSDSDAEIMEKVVAYYQRELPNDDAALGLIEEHKLDRRAVAAFRIGVASGTLGLRLPKTNRLAGRELRARVFALGLTRESGHEQLRGALVVPLTDKHGAIVNLYGRRLDPSQAGEHFFTDASRRGLFNVAGLEDAKEIVITGSVLDALSVWSIGCTHVTSFHGADGPLDELLSLVKACGARRVTLAVKRTAELVAVTHQLTEAITAMGIEVLRAVLPGSQDANDVLRGEDGAYRLGQLLRSAEWVGGVARTAASAPAAGAAEPAQPSALSTTARPAAAPPAAPASDGETGEVYGFEDRRWRIRGLSDNLARGTLKLNVFVSREGAGFHVDSFDLYSARHRTAFLHQAAIELGMDEAALKRDLGQVLLQLEIAQEAMLAKLHAPEVKAPEMKEREREDALELLRDPKLLERVLAAFETMGIVGEKENLIAGYLVAVSRKLTHPLAMVIQSSSAAGKSALLEAILSTVPEEELFSYAAVSGQSLYYMGKRSLRHRLLSIAEEVGAEKASHALKLLQSSKELTIASTGKDGVSGRITSHEYKVEGPVALMITTSKIELDDELLNRCLVLTIDESPEQTKAVHEAQRKAQTLQGMLLAGKRLELEQLHKNAQRLLRPVLVVNPHIEEIAFQDRRVRARRDHRKLLSLIEAIALLHQHQRPLKKHEEIGSRVLEYIEATREDIALAQELIAGIAGGATDELPPRTRELCALLGRYVEGRMQEGVTRLPFTFSRREVREAIGWGDTQLKTHLRRLVDAELVVVHRADHGRGVAYELAFDTSDSQWSAPRAGLGRPKVGPRSALGRPPSSEVNAMEAHDNSAPCEEPSEIALPGLKTRRAELIDVPRAS